MAFRINGLSTLILNAFIYVKEEQIMTIAGLSSQYSTYANNLYQRTAKSGDSFMGIMSAASKKVEEQENGEIIGFGTIMELNTDRGWCMKAKYAENSAPENPIIYVETNYGGETVAYNISINKVNPRNASRLEIFALASYADDQGIGCDSTFGTYNTLNNFEEMAIHNGYFETGVKAASTWEQFENQKLDWENACRQLMDLFYNCNDLRQYKNGMDIMSLFSKMEASR